MDIDKLAKLYTPSVRGMSHEDRVAGITQMIADLQRLAKDDGCVAAAWALEAIDRYQYLIESLKELR